MNPWQSKLKTDPIPLLLGIPDESLRYFIHRDLLGDPTGNVELMWELPEATGLIRKQTSKGNWEYPSHAKREDPLFNYDLLETYRSLRILVDMYGFTRNHPVIEQAAGYVFSCQTPEGDIRGILGNQYMPYYHAVLLEELIKAGYAKDKRVLKGLDWLLSVRQQDGGWIVPFQAVPAIEKNHLWGKAPLPPERNLPFSHLATGMVLRAFAAHPAYRQRIEVLQAGQLLVGRFFRPDEYYDRKAAEYWLKFQYPFFWPNLLTALELLHPLGFTSEDEGVRKGLAWFMENQQPDGFWATEYNKGKNATRSIPWVALAICRVMQKYSG